MRTTVAVAVVAALLAAGMAEAGKGCLRLSAERDNSVEQSNGIQVRVTARSACGTTLAGRDQKFVVTVYDASARAAGNQQGRFYGTIDPGGTAETSVFVLCNPDRVRRIAVSAVD